MNPSPVQGQTAIGVQILRNSNRLVECRSRRPFTGLFKPGSGADRPRNHVFDIIVRKSGAGIRLIAQSQDMIRHRIAANGHIPIARPVRQIENLPRPFDLSGHHILRTIGDESGDGIGGRLFDVEIEILQTEQGAVHIEHTAHD